MRALLLAVSMYIVLGMLSGCGSTVNNTVDDSFYERSSELSEQGSEQYSEKMDKIYGDTLERLTDTDEEVEKWEGTDIFDKTTRKLLRGWQRTYYSFRTISPMICITSIVCGILMCALARKNKQIRRAGLYIFVIAIPVSVIVGVFAVGIANGLLLY